MGIGETIKGTVKESAGKVTGNDALENEGAAQQDKGEEETKATEARAEAQAHEKKADALQREQDSV